MRRIAKKSVALVATLVLFAIAFVYRDALARFVLLRIADAVTGTAISVHSMRITARQAMFQGINVRSSRGEPIANIEQIVATYDLREALPGGKRFLGLSSIHVVRPRITLLRRADGTFAFPLPSNTGQGKSVPIHMMLRLDDGSLAFTDQTRIDPASRILRLDDVNGTADLDVNAASHYSVVAAYRESDRRYPMRGSGTIDATTGFNAQHWSAARIPLAHLINYGANSPQMRADAGDLRDIEVRALAFADDRGTSHSHLAAHATLGGLRVAIKGLSMPARDIRGTLNAYDNGMLSRDVVANVGDIPVRISGGVLDFAHPTLRVNATGHATFSQLRRLAPAIARTPLDGILSFSIAVEGDASAPHTFVSLSSPRVAFNGIPLDQPRGTLAVDANEADVLGFTASYGDARLEGRGRVAFIRKPDALLMVGHIDAPVNAIPYAAGVTPGMTLRADVLARGADPQKIEASGTLSGATPTQMLGGTFDVDEQGAGTIGPLFIGNDRHWLYARALLDHPHNRAAALIGAHDFRIRPVTTTALLKQRIALPSIGGTLDANLFGAQDGSRVGVAGTIRAAGASVENVVLGDADAHFDALLGSNESIVQIRNATIDLAQAPHLPIRGLDATIGLRANAFRIYAASARAAGGEIDVSGDSQSRSGIAAVAKKLDPSAFADFGSPLRSGKLSLAATLAGSATHPVLNGVFVLDGSRYRNAPIGAGARISFLNKTFSLRDAVMRVGPSILDADGNVAGLDIAARAYKPQYDLRVRLRAADAHEAALLALPSFANDVQGNVEADLRVGGAGSHPRVAGSVTVPEASYRGLAMSDLSGNLSVDPNGAAFRADAMFGSTAVIASVSATTTGDMRANLRAPRSNLSDFNDFFDDGDMLAGDGYVDLAARMNSGRLQSSGNVWFSDARVQRFALDDMRARWSSAGRAIAFDAQANAANERARITGTATLPTRISLRTLPNAMLRSTISMRADLGNIDLAERLPQFGSSAPVTGFLDIAATARGRYPDLDITAQADVRNATAAGMPIQQLNAAGSLMRGRGSLTSAHLQIASLQADASGSFGLHPNDQTNIVAHASSADVGAILKKVLHHDTDIAGSFDTTLRIRGSLPRPSIDDDFRFSSLRYQRFVLPQIRGEIAADRKAIALRGGEIDLTKGRVELSGVVPLPARSVFDASRTPISLTLVAEDADASNFVDLLAQGTKASGRLDGNLHVGGTLGRPDFQGLLTFANGSLAQPKERVSFSDVGARLAFAGTSATLQSFHAQAGTGTLDATGTASIPNLHDEQQTRLLFNAHADQAVLDIPGKFKGRVDGDLFVKRNPDEIATIGGTLAVSRTRIPMTALTPSKSSQSSTMPVDLAFALQVNVGDDVRVQSSALDVGAKGQLALNGMLSSPTLDGRLKSTGGSMDFYRHFDLQSGTLAFTPSQGVIPYADITATTNIPSPNTDVTLRATGPATNLNVQLASDPSYSRDQILGLLVGAQQIGALSGVASTSAGNFSASSALQQTAMGQVNQAFTRNLLEPLSSKLGSSLGFENLSLTNNFGRNFNANAVKKLGKRVDVSFAQALGTTPRSSIRLDFRPQVGTYLALTAYQQTETTLNAITAPQIAGNNPSQQGAVQLQSMEGEQGFMFSLERRWFP